MIKWMVALLTMAVAAAAEAGPRSVTLDDPNVYYVGRFDHRDPAEPRFEWSNSSIAVRFRGGEVDFRLRDTGRDEYQIVVDAKPTTVARVGSTGETVKVPCTPADGEHTVQIVKRTEPLVGCGQLLGIELPDGSELLPPKRLNRRIEVIGDSISCGYGNEASSEHEHFSPRTENGYLSYGAIAARAVGAEYVCIAWSGRKMWPDNTIPDIYDRTLPTDPTSTWPFDAPPPQVVLINLATNDFGRANPNRAGWTGAYEQFVHRVRGHYPHALIYLASGTMMSDQWPPGQRAASTLADYLAQIQSDLKAAGDTNIRLLPFGVQDAMVDKLGADYHPSLGTDRKMAAKFVAAVQRDLGWTAASAHP